MAASLPLRCLPCHALCLLAPAVHLARPCLHGRHAATRPGRLPRRPGPLPRDRYSSKAAFDAHLNTDVAKKFFSDYLVSCLPALRAPNGVCAAWHQIAPSWEQQLLLHRVAPSRG